MNSDLWYPLPPDMTVWNTAIAENISRKIPEIPSYITAISWSKMDPATGDADGLVELLGGIASAPVTIRQHKLAPMDILAAKTPSGEVKFYPLSPLFLQKLYADNVIGEPVENMPDRDESYEGPGKRVEHIKTVDATKYASAETAGRLIEEITKSASVANWMAENMPETIVALYERSQGTIEKTASILDNMPDLTYITKVGSRFYGNGEPISAAAVAEFCKTAYISAEDRAALMQGVPLVVDLREKLASLRIPTEQEVTVADAIADPFAEEEGRKDAEPPKIAVTTAYMKDGEVKQGIIFTGDALDGSFETDDGTVPASKLIQDKVSDASNVRKNWRELFICEDGYGFNDAIKTGVRINLPLSLLRSMSEPSSPAIGMVGVVLSPYSVSDFGRVDGVTHLGRYTMITLYSLVNHLSQNYYIDNERQFYEVHDKILPVVNEGQITDTITMTGINGTVTRDNMGNLVLEGVTHSAINCPYALMSKYAASYEDAKKVVDTAMALGRCHFDVYDMAVKTAAENDNPDKTKTRKGTKSGTDDEPGRGSGDTISEEDIFGPQLAQTTPEVMMSVGEPGSTSMGGPAAGTVASMPITINDMENIVQINSPKIMDAYLMSNLASENQASKDTLLKASDSITQALSHLSQMLFLCRQGTLNFVSENDIQVAMNKLTDVAQSLGMTTSQIGV